MPKQVLRVRIAFYWRSLMAEEKPIYFKISLDLTMMGRSIFLEYFHKYCRQRVSAT
jgi:hypothetical protein